MFVLFVLVVLRYQLSGVNDVVITLRQSSLMFTPDSSGTVDDLTRGDMSTWGKECTFCFIEAETLS